MRLKATIAVLLFCVVLAGCQSAPAPDIPRYTADQVIAVAKAYAGDECGSTKWQQSRYPKASWTTEYLGNGKWRVTKDCRPYAAKSSWTFYEATGELK